MMVELELIDEHLIKWRTHVQGSHNPFPKHIEEKELQLEERLMTIIGMSMMKGRT